MRLSVLDLFCCSTATTKGTARKLLFSPIYPITPLPLPLATILTWQPRVFELDVNDGEFLGAVSVKRDGYTGLAVGAEASFDAASLLGKGDATDQADYEPGSVAEQEAEVGEEATEQSEIPAVETLTNGAEEAVVDPGQLGQVEFEGNLAGTLIGAP